VARQTSAQPAQGHMHQGPQKQSLVRVPSEFDSPSNSLVLITLKYGAKLQKEG
jgi:hypothetical protein